MTKVVGCLGCYGECDAFGRTRCTVPVMHGVSFPGHVIACFRLKMPLPMTRKRGAIEQRRKSRRDISLNGKHDMEALLRSV
jgi:hypothetical protein